MNNMAVLSAKTLLNTGMYVDLRKNKNATAIEKMEYDSVTA
jgi:hypothetical protein